MTDRPPPDLSRIPGAHRAFYLPTPGSVPPPPPPKRPSWWSRSKKTLAITAAAVFGVGGVFGGVVQYFSDRANDAAEQAFSDPLFAFDVKLLDPPEYYDTGRVIPGATTDADFDQIDWDPVHAALPDAEWTIANDGSPAGWGRWEIALQGNRDETVTVTDIYATDIECSAPEGGTYFPALSQGIGEKIGLALEIDAPGAQIKELPTGQPNSFDPPDLDALPAFSDTATLTFDRGETEVISFQAHADEEYCEFALAVEYLADEKRQTSLVHPETPGHFAVAPVLDYAEFDSVLVPWWFCTDGQAHAFSGAEAAQLYADFEASPGPPVDCA
jgi:hypothetical protein